MDQPEVLNDTSAESERSKSKSAALLLLILAVLWLGLSWMYGWFPFVVGSTGESSDTLLPLSAEVIEKALEEGDDSDLAPLSEDAIEAALEKNQE